MNVTRTLCLLLLVLLCACSGSSAGSSGSSGAGGNGATTTTSSTGHSSTASSVSGAAAASASSGAVATTTGGSSGAASSAASSTASSTSTSSSGASGSSSSSGGSSSGGALDAGCDAIAAGSTLLLGDPCLAPTSDGIPFDQAEAFQIVATESGTSAEVYLYVQWAGEAGEVDMGIYSDASGQPGSLLGQGKITTLANSSWSEAPLPGVSLTAGTTYWLAVLSVGGGTLYLGFFDSYDYPNATTAVFYPTPGIATLPATWMSGGDIAQRGPITAFVTN